MSNGSISHSCDDLYSITDEQVGGEMAEVLSMQLGTAIRWCERYHISFHVIIMTINVTVMSHFIYIYICRIAITYSKYYYYHFNFIFNFKELLICVPLVFYDVLYDCIYCRVAVSILYTLLGFLPTYCRLLWREDWHVLSFPWVLYYAVDYACGHWIFLLDQCGSRW